MPLILKRPWTRQPQVAERVDWGNPLAARLIVASSPGRSGYNAVDGQRLIVTTQTAPSPTLRGIALDHSAGANAAYFPAALPSGGTAYTMLTIAASVNEARSAYALMIGDEVANGNSQARLGLNTALNGDGAAGKFALVEYGGGAYRAQIEASTINYVDGNLHVYGAVRNGSDVSLWFDGAMVASNSAAAGSITPAQRVYVSGSGNLSTASVNKQVLALVWLRALSAAEMAAVSANPWQLFAPLPRRIWAPGALTAPAALTAAATASATATAALTTAVVLAATAQATAQATGALTTAISLSGAPASQATAAAALTTSIQLAASATAQAQATAEFPTTAAALQAASAATSTVTGALTTAVQCVAAAVASASATGVLTTAVSLAAAASAASAATAALTVPIIDVSAAAVWAYVLPNGKTAGQTLAENNEMLRIVLAAVSGKTAGIGGATETYFGADGTTPRVIATFDSRGNRVTVVTNGVA